MDETAGVDGRSGEGAGPGPVAGFGDLHPGLSRQAAIAEANRCLYCFDAPCIQACPTHIEVPKFIKRIAQENLPGSARTILEANILGASCARACPVAVLCEGACVMHHDGQKPIEIGRLQRFAMDAFTASGAPLPLTAGAETGWSVALVGAGPASLACAAELRRRGIGATLFDERALPGGLNTYGVAEYKLPLAESVREIELLTQLGVELRPGVRIDTEELVRLESEYDAIFLGIGMGAIRRMGLPQEEMPGVTNALDFIAGYKGGAMRRVAGSVMVIGAGNTAIDAAIAAVRLGARAVMVVYRRGPEEMSAFGFEYEQALREGVRFVWHRQVVGIEGRGAVEAVMLAPYGQMGEPVRYEVELVIVSIGQAPQDAVLVDVRREQGRIVIDRETGQTSKAGYFAGGDCTNGGREVVDAVADGKRAAAGIAAWLQAKGGAHA